SFVFFFLGGDRTTASAVRRVRSPEHFTSTGLPKNHAYGTGRLTVTPDCQKANRTRRNLAGPHGGGSSAGSSWRWVRGGRREVGDQVADRGVSQRGGEARGHDRGGARADLLHLVAPDDGGLGVRVRHLDRAGALGADDAGEHLAVLGGYGVGRIIRA